MPIYALIIMDIVAIGALMFGVYYPRHKRQEIVVAAVSLNIGVLAVARALSTSSVSIGVGVGLMGVLSIVRLRSTQLGHDEVAYYFSALALGLLAAFPVEPDWLAPVLCGAIVVALYVTDHPRFNNRHRHATVIVDRACSDEDDLKFELEGRLRAKILGLTIRRIDLVDDSTLVDVRLGTQSRHASDIDLRTSSQERLGHSRQ